MQYICKKHHPRLTVGRDYREILPHANAYNACVWNDEGSPEYLPRDEFFDIKK